MPTPVLAPCPTCRRHVRAGSEQCPFCAAPVGAAPPRALPSATTRLTRAAAFAFGAAALAACGGGEPKPEGTALVRESTSGGGDQQRIVQNTPPPPPPRPDAGPAVVEQDWHHNHAMPYGAPPSRARVI